MFNFPQQNYDQWTKPATEAFEFWVSFWPVAPVFGVKWQFADHFAPVSKTVTPKPVKKAKAPAAKPKAPVARVAAPAVETPETKKATPAAKAEAVAKAPAAPKPVAAKPAAPVKADDLKMIKGVGPGLEKQLNDLGVKTFAQIAGMSKADLETIDAKLTSFKGRCFRDDWVGQAKALLG